MILDLVENCERYYGVHKKFREAFEFIKKAIQDDLPVGKYEIDGENVYASVQEYDTKAPSDGKFEGHREYIDIQYIIRGVERMDVVDLSKVQTMTGYDCEKDLEFFLDTDNYTSAVVSQGEYCIFFPNDIHKPCLNLNNQTSVKKMVVKVKV